MAMSGGFPMGTYTIAVSTGSRVDTFDLASGTRTASLELAALRNGTGSVVTRRMLAIDFVGRSTRSGFRCQMRDDLVAVKIEIDPFLGAPPLRTAEQFAIKLPRSREIVDREGEVERRQAHGRDLPPGAAPRNDEGA